jgi:FKBP12-rapamycin complex-associated protein
LHEPFSCPIEERQRSLCWYVNFYNLVEILPGFVAIGKVSIAIGYNISPYLDSILQNVKEALSLRPTYIINANAYYIFSRSKGSSSDASLFQCLRMLSQAVGPALTKYMHELLDMMFAYGLSDNLHLTLVDLVLNIPPLLPSIQGY